MGASTDSILAAVQARPDIGTTNEGYISRLIEMAQALIVGRCNLPFWPEADAQGYSKGRTGASENISALSQTSLLIKVNDSEKEEITLNLAAGTSGAAIAAEVQRAIRAHLSSGSYGYKDLSLVTVAFAGSGATAQYTITSGKYGEDSRVIVSIDDDSTLIADALRLGRDMGGEEKEGVWRNTYLEAACARIVEQTFRAYRMVLEVYQENPEQALSRIQLELDPIAEQIIKANRRYKV